jgi:DNA repair protein RecO (recombination protein O)
MEWRDEGIVLSVRGHGETSAIVEVFTAEHGRVMGLVRGGRSRRLRPILQSGNSIELTWRARLEEHLGMMMVEATAFRAGFIMENAVRLAGLSALTSLAQVLPEREPHKKLYDASRIVLDALDHDHDDVWPALYVRWEMGLLDELGFGLDLSECAATGQGHDLTYVSPKSGRAVSRDAGKPYCNKLLPLPAFLMGEFEAPQGDVMDGLKLTGYFLERHVMAPRQLALPPARGLLVNGLFQRAKVDA